MAEIDPGVLVIVTPTGNEEVVFDIGIVWSLLAGGSLLVGAVVQWWRERRQDPPGEQA